MRNVLLFGSGYFGDHLFQDENGGHFIDVPSDRMSDVGESERCFTVTGCVLDGTLCYIGVNGDLPTANDVQIAVEKMRQRYPVKNSRRIERLNQVNFRDAPMQSYTALHATEEIDVFVFGEGWDGQTVYVEPYICLYLPCRDGSRHLKSFELHYHQRFGMGYLLAVRGNPPAEDEINAIIDKRNLKHPRSKY